MHSEMLRITADAIGLLAFGYDFNGIASACAPQARAPARTRTARGAHIDAGT